MNCSNVWQCRVSCIISGVCPAIRVYFVSSISHTMVTKAHKNRLLRPLGAGQTCLSLARIHTDTLLFSRPHAPLQLSNLDPVSKTTTPGRTQTNTKTARQNNTRPSAPHRRRYISRPAALPPVSRGTSSSFDQHGTSQTHNKPLLATHTQSTTRSASYATLTSCPAWRRRRAPSFCLRARARRALAGASSAAP